MTAAKRVLIAGNELCHPGGITNYYSLLVQHYSSESIGVEYFAMGSRAKDFYSPVKRALLLPLRLIADLIRLAMHLIRNPEVVAVQVSPSLIPVALCRDGLVLLTARALRRQTVVFFRGWRPGFVELLTRRRLLKGIFGFVYARTTFQFLLDQGPRPAHPLRRRRWRECTNPMPWPRSSCWGNLLATRAARIHLPMHRCWIFRRPPPSHPPEQSRKVRAHAGVVRTGRPSHACGGCRRF